MQYHVIIMHMWLMYLFIYIFIIFVLFIYTVQYIAYVLSMLDVMLFILWRQGQDQAMLGLIRSLSNFDSLKS